MDHVLVSDEGPIRIVTLNNPDKGNAISKPMGEAVQAAMREFEARDDLVSRIPHKIAMEIMLLCRTVDAQRAASIGLVNEVVADGKALETAKAWALELTGMAPMVVSELKRMVTEEILPRGPSEQMAIHGQRMSAIRASEDFAEGKAAFREKHPPNFRGR